MVQTHTHTLNQEEQTTTSENSHILNLTGQNQSDDHSHQVRFTEDTVDNEHMNKKKTKICCIYHPSEEEEANCTHTHGHKDEDEVEDLSSDDEDEQKLSYSERRARRIARRKLELEHLEKGEYVPANSYEIQPDYTNKEK